MHFEQGCRFPNCQNPLGLLVHDQFCQNKYALIPSASGNSMALIG